MEQKFGNGDVCYCENPNGEDFLVKVTECILDEDNNWWYEVEPLEFNSFRREVPQSKLRMA